MTLLHRKLLVGVLFALLGVAAPALAHPDLEEAQHLAKQLELEPALAAYQRALDSNTLRFDELVQLLSERILVLHGMRRDEERDADLIWLTAIAPMHDLDVRAPPEVVAKYRTLRAQSVGPLAIRLSAEVTSSVDARTRLAGRVPEGMRVRIWARANGSMWQYTEGATLRHVAIPGSQLELYTEALGPGGVAVAHDYSAEDPLRVSVPGAAAAPPAAPLADAPPRDGASWARRHRTWLIAGSVLVAAGGAMAAYFLLRDDDDPSKPESTRITPMVSF